MADTTTPPVCCGQHDYSPKPGEPVVLGCQLCPNSDTYWRKTKTQRSE